MRFGLIMEQCCGTPDGMGVTPAGVPHQYVPVAHTSPMDAMAHKVLRKSKKTGDRS